MEYSLEDKALCEALSDAFVDNKVDYEYIASIAKNYPLEHVEYMFFNYVAPACYYNTTTPVPPVVYFFNADELHADIEQIMNREKTIYGRLWMKLFVYYLRYNFQDVWHELKSFL